MICLLLEYEWVLTEFLRLHGNDAIFMQLARLRESGPRLRYPAAEHVDDGIWALRANSKEGPLRVFYFFGPDVRQVTILLAGVKKRRKINPDDIKLAKKRRARVRNNQVLLNVYAVRN